MVGRLYNLLRSNAFLAWLVGGIGGVFPDIDHIPTFLGCEIRSEFLSEFSLAVGIALPDEPYGRAFHGIFMAAAIALCGYSLTRVSRHI